MAVPPWRSMRPTIESAMPLPPRRQVAASNPVPRPARIAVTASVVDLRVDRDRRGARVAGGVVGRLAGRVHQRPEPVVDRRVAHHHRLNRHAVEAFDPRGHLVDDTHSICDPFSPARARPYSHARSSRSCPRARPAISCEEEDTLDHRQGLQHRVVQMGGHLRPLLGADALPPLVGELADQLVHPRPEDQAEAGHGDQRRRRRRCERLRARCSTARKVVIPAMTRRAPDGQAAAWTARSGPRPGSGGSRGELRQPRAAAVVASGPEHGRAERGQAHRPHERVAEPQAQLAEQEEETRDHQRHRDDLGGAVDRGGSAASGQAGAAAVSTGVRLGFGLGAEQPSEQVQHHAEPGRRTPAPRTPVG